jgi:hypothetical protein
VSARQSPVERDARRYAAIHLQGQRDYPRDRTPVELLDAAAHQLARITAQYVVSGNMPEARRNAAACQLLADSSARMSARKSRERDAKNAAQEAVHGITAGDVVRGVRGGGNLPVGAECTIEGVAGNILWATIDGERHVVWAADVERVAPDPIRDSGIGDLQVGDDVLTPSRGAGVVEHVDIVSGVTVRVAGDTWRYEPEQLTRATPAERCSACAAHPGWAHGDQTRRDEPRDLCRACLGSGNRGVHVAVPA